jgi:tetratricopeptide (TPR) repeat protein
VFHKVCAHELALRREAARHAASKGDRLGALAAFEAVCADDADDPQSLAELMDAAHSAERPDQAAAAAERLLRHPKVTAALRGRAHALLGDLALQRGDRVRAAAEYGRAEKLPLEDNLARLVTVKRQAATDPPGPTNDALVRFLSTAPSTHDVALDLYNLSELVHADPERALFRYLLARQLEARGQFAAAARELDRALSDGGKGLPDARFVREALRLLGRCRFRAGELPAARAAFTRLRDAPAAPEAVQLEAVDWLERIEFEGRRTMLTGPQR